jgi:ribosomal protein S12 methylthiotransferase accessory factor
MYQPPASALYMGVMRSGGQHQQRATGAGVTVGDTDTLDMGRLAGLISPIGGVISGLERLAPEITASSDTVTLARLGEVGALRGPSSPIRFGVELDGIGCHADPGVSARIAAVEALERYAAAIGDERRQVISSALEMGRDGIDLSDAARCSAAELAAPGCPLTEWDAGQPLRWVRGWSMVDGREVWVPAVMAQLGIGTAYPAERAWLQSSSGCAAGATQEEALLGACCELIERDAVAIAWLQRLPLSRLDPTDPPLCSRGQLSGGDPNWGWDTVVSTLAGDRDRARIALFDATLDLGVPTVLAILLPPPGSGLPPAVGAGCCDLASRAALKAVRELAVVRACLWRDDSAGPPAEVPDRAFDHLFDARDHRDAACPAAVSAFAPRPSLDGRPSGTVAHSLARVTTILAEDSGDVVAVDLTPAELESSGVQVVRVIAPSLIPHLAHQGASYLGSRRLYEVPRRLGFSVRSPEEVNPWPSPLW